MPFLIVYSGGHGGGYGGHHYLALYKFMELGLTWRLNQSLDEPRLIFNWRLWIYFKKIITYKFLNY